MTLNDFKKWGYVAVNETHSKTSMKIRLESTISLFENPEKDPFMSITEIETFCRNIINNHEAFTTETCCVYIGFGLKERAEIEPYAWTTYRGNLLFIESINLIINTL